MGNCPRYWRVPRTPRDKPLEFRHPSWRRYQREAVDSILRAFEDHKVVFLQAPTGLGKSLSAISVAKLISRPRSMILAHTKALQSQYLDEFDDHLVEIRGRQNSPCYRNKKFTAADGPCAMGYRCPDRSHCEYFINKAAAASFQSPVVTNYHYFLYEANTSGDFSKLHLLVCDEGHLVENSLMSIVDVRLDRKIFRRVGFPLPEFGSIMAAMNWAKMVAPQLEAQLLDIVQFTKETGDELSIFSDEMAIMRYREITSVLEQLQRMLRLCDQTWILDSYKPCVKLRPVWVSNYGNRMLFRHADKILIQSATILSAERVSKLLGLDDYAFIQVPSIFPKENRPFYYWPICRLGIKADNDQMTSALGGVDAIISRYPNQKGIIHTVNYTLTDFIAQKSRFKDRFVTHDLHNREKAFKHFLSTPETILLSPSAMTGISPDYDLCTFQIQVKMPFMDMGDRQTELRRKEDPAWYNFQTAFACVQSAGRAMRAVDDYGDTYMLDGNFGWFYAENHELFPSWFREAVVKIRTLP